MLFDLFGNPLNKRTTGFDFMRLVATRPIGLVIGFSPARRIYRVPSPVVLPLFVPRLSSFNTVDAEQLISAAILRRE